MIKVSVVGMGNGYQDAVERAMGLGAQGLTHVVGSYDSGYIVASEEFTISDDGDSIADIVSMVEHSTEGTVGILNGDLEYIKVEVVL